MSYFRLVRGSAVLALFSVLTPAAPALLAAQGAPNDPRAVALLDRVITRMGGEQALRSVRGIRMDVMTQWQRTNFADHPFADQPSYERNTELRDYPARAWRNVREFVPTPSSSVDIVRDTVGARTLIAPGRPAATTPLNLAYVDERRELWATATERLVLAARDAGGLKLLTDTLIDRAPHARMAVAVDGLPMTLFIRRSDDLPAMVRFKADETNDFGLAPWGLMEVEYWYSGWARLAPGVLLPRQRDVRRVGRPYKRMTLLSAVVNPPTPADSFAIADSVVSRYLADEQRPMWKVSLDTTKLVAEHFAAFSPWVGMAGAVRVGGTWVLLETGQAAGAAQLVESWIAKTTPGQPIGAAIITNTGVGNGGVRHVVERKRPVYVAPGAMPMVKQMLGATRAAAAVTPVSAARWVRVGTDSLWIEPIDAPDAGTSLLVYAPTHKWIYTALYGRPPAQPMIDAAVARLRARGMAVEWVGSLRDIHAAMPAAR